MRRRYALARFLVSAVLMIGAPAGAAKAPATRAPVAQRPLHVPPFSTPPAFSAFGPELSRALAERLQRDHLEVQASAGDADPAQTISGRLEELPGAGGAIRLHASYQGSPVQATGDLEHIDELVQEIAQ